MLTSVQCRLARALLDWSVKTLAERSQVHWDTIRRFEKGESVTRRGTVVSLKATLEQHGVAFTNGGMVELRLDRDDAAPRKAAAKPNGLLREEFVIVGFMPGKSAEQTVRALALAYLLGDQIIYAGRVASGITPLERRQIFRRLQAIVAPAPAFSILKSRPEVDIAGMTFVQPLLTARIDFRGRTASGELQQAMFRGICAEQPAGETALPRVHAKIQV